MKFEIIYKIDPPGVFGLPQDGITVLPAGEEQQIYGPSIHRKSGKQVGFGTLSEYRSDENALEVSISLDSADIKFSDNNVFIKLNADDSTSAFSQATDILGNFLQHLTLEVGRVFEYDCLIIQDENDQIYNVPEVIQNFRMTSYNIENLKSSIESSALFYGVKDEKLNRALQYYEHSLLLFEKRKEITDLLSRHYTQLLSSVFLNLWKSVSVIIGDPSKDNDYQSRYKSLGFTYEYFEEKIEFLRDLRNDFDVAHYSLDEESHKKIEENFRKAVRIVTEILKKYRNTLKQ